MERFDLPHEQISWWEDRTFHFKVPFPLNFIYHNRNFGFLVNFNFVLLIWAISYFGSNFGQLCSMFLCLVVTILNSERELNWVSFLEKI